MVIPNAQLTNVKPMTRKMQAEQTREALRNEWSSWEAPYRELGRYFRPRMPKFLGDVSNQGDRRDQRIVNNHGGFAVRTLSSGMMAGITSPSRPWFKLTVPDKELSEVKAVKMWLEDTEQRMQTVFLRSNLYQQLPKLYTSLGVFGTGAMFAEEDDETVVRFNAAPIGSFYIATDKRGRVNTYCRDFQMTVRQLVAKFGYDKCTQAVKDRYDNNALDEWIDVVHLIQENDNYHHPDEGMKFTQGKYKKFISLYYERGDDISDEDDNFLRESGYDEFPLMCPRWTTDGDDYYGTSCGWDAIGDTIQLQDLERQISLAHELQIRPPMVGDPSLRGRKKSMVPAGMTYAKFDGRNASFRPLFEVQWDTRGTENDVARIEHRISRAFYEDLFLMLANSDRRQITATEVAERQEEKLLALGPVLETLNDELLDPIIDRTFAIMMRRGEFMEVPEELSEMDLKIEYVSIMAQAQKMVGLRGMEMAVNFDAMVAGMKPDTLDVTNFDEMIREYHEKVGLSPINTNTPEEVQQVRQARAKQQQAAQQMQMDMAKAEQAKTMSETDTGGNNALSDMVNQRNEEVMV